MSLTIAALYYPTVPGCAALRAEARALSLKHGVSITDNLKGSYVDPVKIVQDVANNSFHYASPYRDSSGRPMLQILGDGVCPLRTMHVTNIAVRLLDPRWAKYPSYNALATA